MSLVTSCKRALGHVSDIVDFGEAQSFLGIRIHYDREKGILHLEQRGYADSILSKFRHEAAAPSALPMDPGLRFTKDMCPTTPLDISRMAPIHPHYRQAVGCLMYLMNCTRPDLAFSMSVFSRFLSNPGPRHWTGIQQVLKYLKGTTDFGITYTRSHTWNLLGYCDSDYANDLDSRCSTTGYVLMGGGGPLQWKSKLQPTVSLFVTQAEYQAACALATDNVWLIQLLAELNYSVLLPMPLWSDNQGALDLIDNPVCHDRTKHIETRYHYVRQQVACGNAIFSYVNTKDNIADLFTKPLTSTNF